MKTNMKKEEKAAAKAAATAKAVDDMEKKVAKAEAEAARAERAAKRLQNATNRLQTLQAGSVKKGLANATLADVHTCRANNVSVQGLIDSTNGLIKEVATTGVPKDIVKCLKAEAANVILANVTEETLPLYIDIKGLYKVEAAYRLVCSQAKNAQLRQLLNNLKKQSK